MDSLPAEAQEKGGGLIMKDTRFAYVVPVVGAVALLVVGLMVYAGFVSGTWWSLLACTPAIVVTIGVVSAISSGMLLFGTEEDETPEEAAAALQQKATSIGTGQ